ncbi:MAG: hypothetical protein WA814_10055, partial [Candidatus Baltobacteraceae bacterium]
MKLRFTAQNVMRLSAVGVLVAFAAGCSGGMTPSTTLPSGASQGALQSIEGVSQFQQQLAQGSLIRACPDLAFGEGRCTAIGLKNTAVAPRSESGPMGSVAGYGPSQLQTA